MTSCYAGVPLHKSCDAIFHENGGAENCMFTDKNMRDHVKKARQLNLGEGDAAALMAYFYLMQRASPDFLYSCSFDDDGRFRNVFWAADSRSRAAFQDFGDVVTFDTTFFTNKSVLLLTIIHFFVSFVVDIDKMVLLLASLSEEHNSNTT